MVGLFRIAAALLACGFLAQPISAQDGPGAGAPLDPAEAPFTHAEPEEVGLSTESLTALANLVRGWTRDTVIVGAEILVVKDGRAVLHEAMGWSRGSRMTGNDRNGPNFHGRSGWTSG